MVDAVSSSDSSFSKNTARTSSTARDQQYEDIDADNTELLQLSAEMYDNMAINTNWGLKQLEHNSGASTSQTQSTLIYAESETEIYKTNTNGSEEATPERTAHSTTRNKKEEEPIDNIPPESNSNMMVTSCVDSGIAGTISVESNLSTVASENEGRKDGILYKVKEQFCNIRMEDNTLGKNIQDAQEVIELDHDSYSCMAGIEERPRMSRGQDHRRSSMLNSQIGSSFYSAADDQQQLEGEHSTRAKSILYKEAELLAAELSPADSLGNTMSDEAFVTKQVLAEQIGSIQLRTNPILHKFCIVPSRHICFGSFIFSTRKAGQPNSAAPNLSAFSVIIPIEKSDWYLERQPLLLELLSDSIARVKAAFLVEGLEDLICRCTRELKTIFLLFGALERWPLASPALQRLRIQGSHLWELRRPKGDGTEFLGRSITACLMCRGRCAVVGTNSKEVGRLLATLCAFLEPRDRLYSLRPYKLQYIPHLRLQAIKRSEVCQFFEQAADAHWPCALLDIDRKSVVCTGPYQRHRAQKRVAQLSQIGQIFREALELGLPVPAPILATLDQQSHHQNGQRGANELETFAVRVDPAVDDFLQQICLLPMSQAARLSFIDHFHLRLENRSRALISYIRDLSAPSPNDKRSALSSKWHLATARRNLNLQQESAFGIALAKADSLEPDFAEFIAQQAAGSRHHSAAGQHC